jgi:hypothetical protein
LISPSPTTQLDCTRAMNTCMDALPMMWIRALHIRQLKVPERSSAVMKGRSDAKKSRREGKEKTAVASDLNLTSLA